MQGKPATNKPCGVLPGFTVATSFLHLSQSERIVSSVTRQRKWFSNIFNAFLYHRCAGRLQTATAHKALISTKNRLFTLWLPLERRNCRCTVTADFEKLTHKKPFLSAWRHSATMNVQCPQLRRQSESVWVNLSNWYIFQLYVRTSLRKGIWKSWTSLQ
jgi:hypothetical protein